MTWDKFEVSFFFRTRNPDKKVREFPFEAPYRSMKFPCKKIGLFQFLATSALVCTMSPISYSTGIPISDPEWDGSKISLTPYASDHHPRLLFDRENIQRIRDFYFSEEGFWVQTKLEGYLSSCVVPEEPTFLRNATDGQRQGLWRLPTVAVHYAITGNTESRDRVIEYLRWLEEQERWEIGKETDSGMSAANIMIGAAIGFDCVYNDLDPEFRELFRSKLWHHARSMYYLGHQRGNGALGYWQNDGQNNHRWHRNAGMTLAALTAYSGSAHQQWLMHKIIEELEAVMSWLPADGTTHESPSYLVFGMPHLMVTLDAADRCFGTQFLQHDFIKTVGEFRAQTITPGMNEAFHYGDSGGLGSYNDAFYLATGTHRQADYQAVLDQTRLNVPDAFSFVWMSAVWYHPELKGGAPENLPKSKFFDDIGLLIVRDGWDLEDVALMFKCGPHGGHLMNKLRDEKQLENVNVAHDDPDANVFTIWLQGEFVAENDRYSKHKRSSNHNTVLVNGVGQTTEGRKEGDVWTQPSIKGTSMADIAYVTATKEFEGMSIVEGEASNAYSTEAINRFRRTLVWNEGKYVMVIDDLGAETAQEFTWLMQGAELSKIESEPAHYLLAKGNAQAEFIVMTNHPTDTCIKISTADNRGKPLGWKQLQLKAETKSIALVSVFLPWGGDVDLDVDFGSDERPSARIRIDSDSFHDVWSWESAQDNDHTSKLRHSFGSKNVEILGGSLRMHWEQ